MEPLPHVSTSQDQGTPVTCDKVRPLSILPMFRRLFETLMLPVFTDSSLCYCKLHPSQAGFRAGYSTLTQAVICHHAIESKRVQFVIFLDFQAAYDVILSHEVMDALRSKSMPARLRSLVLSSMFTNASYNVVVNSHLSDSISRNRGLPQGSPLSPVIFNLFIDSLVVELNRLNHSDIPLCLFYADDGALLAPDLATAKLLLRIAERWAKEHNMIYNVSKCGVISVQGLPVELTLAGELIPVLNAYQYLGFPMTAKGIDFLYHIATVNESAKRFLNFLQIDGQEWAPGIRWAIYRTFVRPQMEYGAPLVKAFVDKHSDLSLLNELQITQNRALAWILCATDVTKHNTHQGILGVLHVNDRFTHLRCRFQLHLDQSFHHNPLRQILRNPLMTIGKLIGQLHRDTLYDGFKRSSEYMEVKQHYKDLDSELLYQYLLSLRTSHLHNLKLGRSLLQCISARSRTERLTDKVLYAPPTFQREFVAWRRGTLFWNQRCICGNLRWNRGHVEHMPYVGLPRKLRRAFDDEKLLRPDHFNVIDFLLNEGKWELAHNILALWKEKLRSAVWYPSFI